MTWTKEDEQKIRSLILNDDIANVKIGIYLALNTLKMSIDELGLLVKTDDIKIVNNGGMRFEQQMVAFGKIMSCHYTNVDTLYTYSHYLTCYSDRIKELLNEI